MHDHVMDADSAVELLTALGAGGVDARCEAPEWSLRWHTGYLARPIDFHDVGRLCEGFDLELPEGFSSLQAARQEP